MLTLWWCFAFISFEVSSGLTPVPIVQPIISEVHYHPPRFDGPNSAGKCLDPISGSTKQFIELHNPDANHAVDLHGYRLRGSWDGPEVVFGPGTFITPKGFVLLRSSAARWIYNDTCYEADTDYLGWDVRTVPKTSGPAQCQALCYGEDQCRYWTYDIGSQYCYLKTSDAGKKPKPGVMSGIKAGCINDYLPLPGLLRKSRGHVTLRSSDGTIVDRVRYKSVPPWPQGPNGLGSSLERTNETDRRLLRRPITWRASWVTGGTPGYPNSVQNEPGLTLLQTYRHEPTHPTSRDNVTVMATFKAFGSSPTAVLLQYEWAEHAVDVARVQMRYDSHAEAWVGMLPPAPSQTLVRYSYILTHTNNYTEQVPCSSDAKFARTYNVYDGEHPSTSTTLWAFGHNWKLRRDKKHIPRPSQLVKPPRVLSAVVIRERGADPPLVFEGATAKLARSGNAKVNFLSHGTFRGIRHLKIGSETLEIRKGADRFSPLVECMGFHLYRLAGSTAPWCEHWRVIGAPGEDQIRSVMPEIRTDFLAQHGFSNKGFLFKAGYAPTIYLQPYPQPEWSCYYAISNLDTAAKDFSEKQLAWRLGNAIRIDDVIDIQSFVDYGVGTMLTSNWDGTSNNHHLYQDPISGIWSIMAWDLDKACGNTKGWDDWPYNYPFGALNNHGLKVMGSNWPDPHPGHSRPANTVLEVIYGHPEVSKRVREKFMRLVYEGIYRQADAYFDVMVAHINTTLHQIYGINMTQPYTPWLQDALFEMALHNLNSGNSSWKAHYRRRENLFIA